MFEFSGSPVAVRPDLRYAYINTWGHFARPGPTFTGEERIDLLRVAREGDGEQLARAGELAPEVIEFACTLYSVPTSVDGDLVRTAAGIAGDATAVEVIALISMLAAVDGTHRALGARLEPLPDPQPGAPTGTVATGLARRRTHVPVPPGPIPYTLDLLPDEGAAFKALFGPQYMTDGEMALDTFRRRPGLDRAQMELISSRTSIHNQCFY